ncbi:MAG: hypothetical protein A3F85_00360 [Candidatus Ryanbacteria bacterium RIFCSPLOWO2_12_FULL_44_26]|nr:MAG: hypothetical protein A2718_02885 [Candidatus Ryanbacteria bacterium RIFCSPHIGHO2_01_FULL_44_130]OGZ55153.1 MAG: hypothetical protein A3F85_00360 [Candidatus Ryanbacteria bacterium RIFCSPLOWO2_12_FULL_44_26]
MAKKKVRVFTAQLEKEGIAQSLAQTLHKAGIREISDFKRVCVHDLAAIGVDKKALASIRNTLKAHDLRIIGDEKRHKKNAHADERLCTVDIKKLQEGMSYATREEKRKARIALLAPYGFRFSNDLLCLPHPTQKQQNNARRILGEEQFVLFHALRCGTREEREWARKELFKKHYALVFFVLRRERWLRISKGTDSTSSPEDSLQEGSIGLLHVFEKYDYARGIRFSTYAIGWIRLYMRREIERANTIRLPAGFQALLTQWNKARRTLIALHGRAPTREEMKKQTKFSDAQVDRFEEVSLFILQHRTAISLPSPGIHENQMDLLLYTISPALKEMLPHSNFRAESADQTFEKKALQLTILRLIGNAKTLNSKQKYIVIKRFGLDGEAPKTLEEIGQEFNVSRERVRQLENHALAKLAKLQSWQNCLKAVI